MTVFLFLNAPRAYAACSNPTGNEGAMIFNDYYNVMQYCDGTDWVSAGQCTVDYPSGVGFFVLSDQKWDGNLGDRAGADAKCLSELQANDWKGKNVATLNSTKVKAFLCDHDTCQLGIPNTTYYFARSNAPSVGGASFTTDGSGFGNVGNDSWASPDHFGGFFSYWIGGRGYSGETVWVADTASSDLECTQQWDSNSSGSSGKIGESGYTDRNRWYSNNGRGCNTTQRLICFVHP